MWISWHVVTVLALIKQSKASTSHKEMLVEEDWIRNLSSNNLLASFKGNSSISLQLDFARNRRGLLLEEGDPVPAWELSPAIAVSVKKTPETKVPCRPLSPTLLSKLLGTAFNPRYMSIEKPFEESTHTNFKSDGGQKHGPKDQPMRKPHENNRQFEAFHVHSGFTRILHDEHVQFPRNTAKSKSTRRHLKTHHKTEKKTVSAQEKFVSSIRSKRNIWSGLPWICSSKVQWVDLGQNHFPRYLRTVECTSEKCWFGHFHCRAKAFTVKVLRRRKDSCTPDTSMVSWEGSIKIPETDEEIDRVAEEDIEEVDHGLPLEFREEWIFEERAVTFCCECAT